MKKLLILLVSFSLTAAYLFAEDSYFTGDGRKDLSIEVDAPQLSGKLSDESTWVPEFVVNMVSDDIAKYSAITIVDIHNQERIIDAQARDYEGASNTADAVEIGNFAIAKNVLLVNITGKPSGYSVSFKINDKEKNISLAAFNEPNCSFTDLENGVVLKKAVADLLNQLGVVLTDYGKKSLLEVATGAANIAANIEAQKDIARGNVALQNGSSIEALSYFVKAKSSDNNLARATKAMSRAGTTMVTTDFASSARNKIKLRNDFIKLIGDTTDYLNKNFPYTVIYDPNLTEGKMNYEKNTFDMNFKYSVLLNTDAIELSQNIRDTYNTMPDHENWNLTTSMSGMIPQGSLIITFEVKDANGSVIGKTANVVYLSSRLNHKVNDGRVTISADADTSVINFNVARVQFVKDSSVSASSYEKNPNQYSDMEMSKLTINDYINKVVVPSIELSEVMPDIYLVTVPRGFDLDDYDSLARKYNIGDHYKLSEATYGKDFSTIKEIMFNADEAKLMQELNRQNSTALNKMIGRNVISPNGKIIVKNEKNPYPRLISEYIKNPTKYLPIEFVSIPESKDYLYIKNTKTLMIHLGLISNGSIKEYVENYQYGKAGLLSSEVEWIKTSALVVGNNSDSSNEVLQLLGSAYPKLYIAIKNNKYYSELFKEYMYSHDDVTESYLKHVISRKESTTESGYDSLPMLSNCYYQKGYDIMPIAIKLSDYCRAKLNTSLVETAVIKKTSYYEVTQNLYAQVKLLATNFKINNSLPDTFNRASFTADVNLEFLRVINILWGKESFKPIDAKVIKNISKDATGKTIGSEPALYIYKK